MYVYVWVIYMDEITPSVSMQLLYYSLWLYQEEALLLISGK